MLQSLKKFAWFIFKSPQRKWVGWHTLFIDFKAWFFRLFFLPYSGDISICVGNFNRSHTLLNRLLDSMNRLENKNQIILSVFDCGSTDIPEIEHTIREKWQGRCIFSQEQIPFTRSVAFNRAIAQSPSDIVLVADADMELPANLVSEIRKYLRKNSAWFPVCQWQINAGGPDWRWFTEGTGIFAATKTQLQKTGCYDEIIRTWGKEDWDLFFRFYKSGIAPFRRRCKGLYHHWHPSLKPDDFEKMF